MRQDLFKIIRAGLRAASADRALVRALADPALRRQLRSSPLHVIAVGKAASEMADAWVRIGRTNDHGTLLVVSTHRGAALPASVEFLLAGHPLPDERSVAAADRALEVAGAVAPDETLLVLLSGGASALMARPLDGISLTDKQQVIQAMLRGGADIHALNTVRKHLSAVKGGRLAAACRGRTITLAISDVVGDDLAVIGSGPGVPDPSTWRDAWNTFERFVPREMQPASVRALLQAGTADRLPETPKPDDELAQRIEARVIAGRFDVMAGAREAAAQLGYEAIVLDEAVTGEARAAAPHWWETARSACGEGRRACVISTGETTVRVVGRGRGGRNQEFVLALVGDVAACRGIALASVGTDGIDGSTDAAGAVIDEATAQRAAQRGLSPEAHLDDNDSNAFFAALGDLIVTGPTGTNVGDLQVLLTSAGSGGPDVRNSHAT